MFRMFVSFFFFFYFTWLQMLHDNTAGEKCVYKKLHFEVAVEASAKAHKIKKVSRNRFIFIPYKQRIKMHGDGMLIKYDPCGIIVWSPKMWNTCRFRPESSLKRSVREFNCKQNIKEGRYIDLQKIIFDIYLNDNFDESLCMRNNTFV